MVNSEDIEKIVDETLNRLGSKDISNRMLIKLTFLMESGLEDLIDENGEKFGFCQMSKNYMTYLIENGVIPRINLMKAINSTCLVNLKKDSFSSLAFNLKTNISFQIAMTYAHYRNAWNVSPKDNIYHVIDYYFRYWKQKPSPTPEKSEKIKNNYERVFGPL